MKKIQFQPIFIILLSAILISACKKDQKKSETICFSAKIQNPNSDSLFIESTYGTDRIKSYKLNNGSLPKDTLRIQMGYYRIFDGEESTACFLKPGYDLEISLNTEEFDESIQYTGNGSAENNYMAKKYLLNENLGSLTNYAYYAKLEEEDFLNLNDSIYNLQKDLLNKYKEEFDEDFIKLESNNIKTEYLSKIANYESMHAFLTGNKEFKVTNDFPNPFKDINLSDDELILIPAYNNFVRLYIEDISSKKVREDTSLKFYSVFIDMIDEKIISKKIKEDVALNFGLYSFKRASDKDYCYKRLKEIITDTSKFKPIEETYSKLQKIKKGAKSPVFELYDIDSNLVKLDDFKSKLVYIDIWSTWCSPCIKEIPHLMKIQEEYKDDNIVFVSICKNDNKERWAKTVTMNKLKGIHLFIHDQKNDFIEDYVVTSVPRFILIDENGYIIDSDAPRPSDPRLKKIIDKNLKS